MSHIHHFRANYFFDTKAVQAKSTDTKFSATNIPCEIRFILERGGGGYLSNALYNL